MKKTLLFHIFLAILTKYSMAGMTAGEFLLNANPNPRLYSMGGLLSAVDYSDAHFNPASLGWGVNYGLFMSYWPGFLEGSRYGFFSAIMPVSKNKKDFFNVSYLSYNAGSETIEELNGNTRHITLEKDDIISFGYGMPISQKVFAGLHLKRLSSVLADDYSSSSILFDLNFIFRSLDDKKTFEIGFLNSGGSLKYLNTKEDLPSEIVLGYSYKNKITHNMPLITSINYSKIKTGGNSVAIGGEIYPKMDFLAIRAGINKQTDMPISFRIGLGLKFERFNFDFSYDLKDRNDYKNSPLYRFALNYFWGPLNKYEAANTYLSAGMKEKALALWNDIDLGEKYYADARGEIKKYMDPPVLQISQVFVDTSKDNILTAGEEGDIQVKITNIGKSPATGIDIKILPQNYLVQNEIRLWPDSAKIASVLPGESEIVNFHISASQELSISNLPFDIIVKESDGFNPPVYNFNLSAKKFPPPQPLIAKYTFREDNTGMSQGNGNGQIEKGETVELTAIITNIGESIAKNVSILPKAASGIEILKIMKRDEDFIQIGNLNPGEYKKIVFVFKVSEYYSGSKELPISVEIKEERPQYSITQPLNLSLGRFYAEPIIAKSAAFSPFLSSLPDLPGPIPGNKISEIIKHSGGGLPELDFYSEISGDTNNNRVFEPGEKLILNLYITNTGKATAKEVELLISGDDIVAKLIGSPYRIGDILPGSQIRRTIEAEIPNSIQTKTSSFTIKLREKNGYNSLRAEEKSIGFIGKAPVILKSYSSILPAPKSGFLDEKSYALVIGISKYQKLQGLKYSTSDAEAVKQYLNGVMGVPEKNIRKLTDEEATKSRIEAEIETIANKNLDTIYFYFAGHGIYDQENPATGQPFMAPYEADLSYGNKMLLSLNDIISKFENTGTQKIYFILDSCFSGEGGRTPEKILLAKRGIAIEPVFKPKKTVVFSAASGRQAAEEFDKVKSGYFTYYFLLGLKGEADTDKNGAITDRELCDYVKSKVEEETGDKQTPECKNITNVIIGKYR